MPAGASPLWPCNQTETVNGRSVAYAYESSDAVHATTSVRRDSAGVWIDTTHPYETFYWCGGEIIARNKHPYIESVGPFRGTVAEARKCAAVMTHAASLGAASQATWDSLNLKHDELCRQRLPDPSTWPLR